MGLARKLARLDAARVLVTVIEPPVLHRVHSTAFDATSFNDSPSGNARFSPLAVAHPAEAGIRIVPTMYAGDTLAVALMEVVLRNVPCPSHGHILRLPARDARVASTLAARGPLSLADLRANGLRRLGLTRTDVVECDAAQYAQTRALAAWIHTHVPRAQGIVWTSRQHGSGDAFMFFGDRIAPRTFAAREAGRPLLDDEVLSVLMDLLDDLGAGLVIDG